MRQEGTIISTAPLALAGEMMGTLLNYFFSHFKKSESTFKLTHPAGREQNAIAAISRRVFEGESLLDESAKAADHLYDVSDHPQIKRGDLYVAKFTGLKFDGQKVDALGFFKSDRAERFLSLEFGSGKPRISVSTGTHLKSFDKGALVFNCNASDGYRVLQATSNSEDAVYWAERFLKLKAVGKDSQQTEEIMRICREYSDGLANAEDPANRMMFLDSSFAYFSSKSRFAAEEFVETLPEELHESFKEFKDRYEEKHKQPIPTNFQVVPSILKREKRLFQAIIKLDDRVEIKVSPLAEHSQESFIEKGYDRRSGRNFYKIYFNEEK